MQLEFFEDTKITKVICSSEFNMASHQDDKTLLDGAIWVNPERMSRAPCFNRTRVPVQNLFDYLANGETITAFLDDFPGVTPAQVEIILTSAKQRFFGALERNENIT